MKPLKTLKPLDAGFLKSRAFNTLPGFDYAEVGEFLLDGRQLKVILASPFDELKAKPCYATAVVFTLGKHDNREVWLPNPWLSGELLAFLGNLPAPEEASACLKRRHEKPGEKPA